MSSSPAILYITSKTNSILYTLSQYTFLCYIKGCFPPCTLKTSFSQGTFYLYVGLDFILLPRLDTNINTHYSTDDCKEYLLQKSRGMKKSENVINIANTVSGAKENVGPNETH